MHDLPLITTVAAAFTAAWVLGLLTQKLGLSPIVGYLLAGVLIGPHTPGYIGDAEIAHQLAELGVILLMFGVGLHFHVKDLLRVRNIAIPGAVGQSLVAMLLAMVVFHEFGMTYKTGAVVGMAMAVASTVVLMRVLMDAGTLDSPQGHVAVGWLIVEDIFTVVLLVLIPVLGTDPSAPVPEHAPAAGSLWATLGLALLKLAALVGIVLTAGARAVPWVLVRVAKLRSRELFTLTVLVFSVAVAAGASLFGASMALGAFLAGMVVAQSPVSHQAAAEVLPLRDAFAVLFFVSVGMLFDPRFMLREPLMLAAALGIILVAKPLAALAIVAMLGQSARTALTVALGLAQIGEFSFILSELSRRYGLMSDVGHNLLVAAAIVSITLNPLLFRSLPAVEAWLRRHPRLWALLNARAERRAARANETVAGLVIDRAALGERLAVVVGFGPVGRSVHRLLQDAGLATVVIDTNMETVTALKSRGEAAIYGDASHESILRQAGIERASHIVLTLPSSSADRAGIVAAVRNLNSEARLWVRARYLRERADLERSGATAAVFEEAEAAVALARLVLADRGVQPEAVNRTVRDLRRQLLAGSLSSIDVLDEVVGRIEDEPPPDCDATLHAALMAGGVVPELRATERDAAIRELAAAIPDDRLPTTHDREFIVRRALEREAELSTDLGIGVAVPHARCPNLPEPLVVAGRAAGGIAFSPQSSVPVRLVLLLVTPAERPETQLALLGRLAQAVADAPRRETILAARERDALIESLCRPDVGN